MKVHSLFLAFFCLLLTTFSTQSIASDCDGLRIITEISPPSALELEDGLVVGFGIEIVEALKKEIGCEADIEVMPWARGYKHLKEHSKIMLFPTTRTPSREKLFKWVGPIAHQSWVFYGHIEKKYNITSLEDAKKVAGIGVYRDDARASFLKKKGFKNLEVVDVQRTNLEKLKRHRVDLVAASTLGIERFFKENEQYRGIFVPVYTFHDVYLYLAFSKSTSQEVLDKWDKAFARLSEKGKIKEILNKWL